MENVNRLLELLYDRGEGFFDLDELARRAGLEQGRLADALDQLEQSGYLLEITPAYGVRLIRPVKLNAHLIERNLGTARIGGSVICFDEVASTNDVAMDSTTAGESDGLVVLAESQRAGRGRQGRRWLSPPGANILLSTVLVEKSRRALPDSAGGFAGQEALTIAAGVAVAEGLDEACGLSCRLKWPNDVLVDGRKIAGILVETRQRNGWQIMVVGLGVNVNACPPDEQTDYPATSAAAHLGHAVERMPVVRSVLRSLDRRVQNVQNGLIDELHDSWLARCGMINERIVVVSAGRRCVGRVVDISPLEGLVLCCDDGQRVKLPAANFTIEK
ncbi:MAG: biotin--[acetyl-CoA-carboxylase] ligase [Planctomycetes bacterium]|nr:biotin--[acetyl-CoA-carboxylase] ligase [Planctomycetota bacterium]